MRVHLRLLAVLLVVGGLTGAVLAMTVLNTDESSNAPPPGSLGSTSTGEVTGPTGPTGGGSTLEYAQAIPLSIEGPLLGVNLTAYSRDGYSQPHVKQAIRTLGDLGSTAITVVPTWYMNSSSSNLIAANREKTPSDESLTKVVTWIREAGMQAILKPHVDVIDDSYRGEIQPADRDKWFRSYEAFIDHYASFSADHGVTLFVVGTELKTLSGETDRWRKVIQEARMRFFGPITYAANWDEVDQVQFWDDLDAIGVDAYYPLSPDDGTAPTFKSLVSSWEGVAQQLKSKSEQWERPVLLTEVGYPSQIGATATPYEVTDKPADQNIQALAYEATFHALSGSEWLKGISWWSWRADPTPDEEVAKGYSPEGKKAQGELAAGQFTFLG